MNFPPMRYKENEEIYGSRPIDPAVDGLLSLFHSPAPDAETQLSLSLKCVQANRKVMGDLYEELVPMGLDVMAGPEPVTSKQVIDLVHKAMAFGEAKMLSRVTIAAQKRAMHHCLASGSLV